jgi:hypothetical protein
MLHIVVTDLHHPGGDDGNRVTKLFHERCAPRRKSSLFHPRQATGNACPGLQNRYPPRQPTAMPKALLRPDFDRCWVTRSSLRCACDQIVIVETCAASTVTPSCSAVR